MNKFKRMVGSSTRSVNSPELEFYLTMRAAKDVPERLRAHHESLLDAIYKTLTEEEQLWLTLGKDKERLTPVSAETLTKMFCTCEVKPLGLPFVLTAGCLMHDSCCCHTAEHDPVVRSDEACAWCGSYIALLIAVGSLDDVARERLKRTYHDEVGDPLNR